MVHKAKRRKRILELVRQHGMVTVAELSEEFGVSDMTIRRDLGNLDQEGLLRRVHGGAVDNAGRSFEPPYLVRSQQNQEAKRRIGQKAVELIFDGDSIALDVGTTTLEVARALGERRSLTIVTSSLPIANEIVSNYSLSNDCRLIVTGGIVRPGELSMIGNFAQEVYENLHVDKAFIGIGGISIEEGLTEYNLDDALVKRVLLATANMKYVVADGSKLGRTTFASVGPLSAVDAIITDASAPETQLRLLREKGVQIIASG